MFIPGGQQLPNLSENIKITSIKCLIYFAISSSHVNTVYFRTVFELYW